MDELKFEGSGLINELPTFIAVMKKRDPVLGRILERHISLLQGSKTDDARKRARTAYNDAVKKDLLDELKKD